MKATSPTGLTGILWVPSQRWTRWLVVLAGILLGQAVLYGPSLVGSKILLPLDILSQPGVLIPPSNQAAYALPHDLVLMDLVNIDEPERIFVGNELRAGRIPRWNPGYFAGAPVLYPWLSPLALVKAWVASPWVIAWIQVFQSLVAGVGMCVFCRRVLEVGYWPSVIAAWCYPVTGFFVLWQGYGVAVPVLWLPWMFFLVHQAVFDSRKWTAPALALLTGIILISGQLDMGGLVLLASGLFAVMCLGILAWRDGWNRRLLHISLILTMAWGTGFMLSAIYVRPVLAYSQTGSRMEKRAAGDEERPPVGLAALPQIFFPKMYGSSKQGSMPLFPAGQGNLLESSAAAYSGFLALAFLVPLGLGRRLHRPLGLALLALAALGMGWSLDIPGLVDVLRLPGLKMLSYNRFVFLTGFATLALAAVGFEQLIRGEATWRRWNWLVVLLLIAGVFWNLNRIIGINTFFEVNLAGEIGQGRSLGTIRSMGDLAVVQRGFIAGQTVATLLCLFGILAWGMVRMPLLSGAWRIGITGCVLIGELLWFGRGQSTQADPALYYPEVPLLRQLAHQTSQRVIGYDCLPSRLAETMGLRDVRGYDGIDPSRMMDVLLMAADPASIQLNYAKTQWLLPKIDFAAPDQLKLHPVLDMLGVGHLIFRGKPGPGVRPYLQGDDYWVLKNGHALPRAYVPQHVETIREDAARLARMNAPGFNAAKVGFVEVAVEVADTVNGTARIVLDEPSHLTVEAELDQPGLLVVADRWDPGWKASIAGKPVTILRADHILRGVVLPAGRSLVEFRYESPFLTGGACLSLTGLLGLLVWVVLAYRTDRRRTSAGPALAASQSSFWRK